MTLVSRLQSRMLTVLLGRRMQRTRRRLSEWHRRARGKAHVVSVFVELDDPYSYLLCDYLPELQRYYDVELRLYLTEALLGSLRPAPELYHEFALTDCRRLAAELGIPFLDQSATPPVEYRRALLDWLASRASADDFRSELIGVLTAYWRGDAEALARRVDKSVTDGSAKTLLEQNRRRLRKLGHYNTATLHYGGEWYWGVDRLHHLIARLDELGVARQPGLAPRIASVRQVMQASLPISPPAAARNLPPLEVFYSLRSPYSWLALERIIAIADAFGMQLEFRPVLPMVMRGMQVPSAKLRYIAFDAQREAAVRGVPFGRIADPLGAGLERCMAVWQYAIGEKRERDFLYNVGEAIWSKGIDLASDEGLRKVSARAGLFWPKVKAALESEAWQDLANENRESMMASGAWGVPTFRIGDWVTWGQDRDWLVVRHLEELCDGGDGIIA